MAGDQDGGAIVMLPRLDSAVILCADEADWRTVTLAEPTSVCVLTW